MGEGLAAREALRYTSVDSVVVVDIDPAIFVLGRTQRQLTQLNERALFDPRLRTVAQDAFVYLRETKVPFDVIIADLPDPTTDALARLYAEEFFRLCLRVVRPGGAVATQATGPFHTGKAYWSIGATLRQAGFAGGDGGESGGLIPYHSYVASFGDWGFYVSLGELGRVSDAPFQTRYYSAAQFEADRLFPRDIAPEPVEANTLDRPVLLDYYLEDWRRLNGEQQVW